MTTHRGRVTTHRGRVSHFRHVSVTQRPAGSPASWWTKGSYPLCSFEQNHRLEEEEPCAVGAGPVTQREGNETPCVRRYRPARVLGTVLTLFVRDVSLVQFDRRCHRDSKKVQIATDAGARMRTQASVPNPVCVSRTGHVSWVTGPLSVKPKATCSSREHPAS